MNKGNDIITNIIFESKIHKPILSINFDFNKQHSITHWSGNWHCSSLISNSITSKNNCNIIVKTIIIQTFVSKKLKHIFLHYTITKMKIVKQNDYRSLSLLIVRRTVIKIIGIKNCRFRPFNSLSMFNLARKTS